MQLSRLFIQSLLEQWSQPPSLAFGRRLQGRQGRRKVFVVKKKKRRRRREGRLQVALIGGVLAWGSWGQADN